MSKVRTVNNVCDGMTSASLWGIDVDGKLLADGKNPAMFSNRDRARIAAKFVDRTGLSRKPKPVRLTMDVHF